LQSSFLFGNLLFSLFGILAVRSALPPHWDVPDDDLFHQVSNDKVDYANNANPELKVWGHLIFFKIEEVDSPRISRACQKVYVEGKHSQKCNSENHIRIQGLTEWFAHTEGYYGAQVLETWDPEDWGVFEALVRIITVRVVWIGYGRGIEVELSHKEECEDLES